MRTALSKGFLERGNLDFAGRSAFKISVADILEALDYCSPHSKPGTAFSGARVALLGPGTVGSPPKLTGSYELIARIGYIDETSSEANLDRPPDYSFLAAHHAIALIDRNRGTKASSQGPIQFLVREDGHFSQMQTLASIKSADWFSIRPSARVFSGVVPNFAPQAIMHILSQGPRELHISHLDLFTSTKYAKGYPTKNRDVSLSQSSLTYSTETVRRSFSQFHNPFTHFSFYQSLLHIPCVTMSTPLRYILSAGISAYGDQLKRLYYTK